ncbi:MAG: rhamnulokinase [Verrucomicrobia subdivision 3 bacterium]|nr:rhamnulokinase [Limisphaerales bacterium]
MEKFYVACDFGVRTSRIMLGTLHNQTLTVNELRRFKTPVNNEKKALQWHIPEIYRETVLALSEVGAQEVNLAGVSCSSWGADYMLFDRDDTLLTPVYHHADPRTNDTLKAVLAKIPAEAIYDETGVQSRPANTLFQLRAESSRRLKRDHRLLPFADGFNHLLGGDRCVEMSLASTTQLFNPARRAWSSRLISELGWPLEMLPPVVSPGAKLGRLRPDVAKQTGLEDVTVIATCSNELSAALAGLPLGHGKDWAYLRIGGESLMGTEVPTQLISRLTRELGYSNESCLGGATNFHKRTVGLWLFEECRRFWIGQDRELSDDVLLHLATTSPAFECLINLADPRFATPGDMPLKIQAYCRETGQEIPRKPGQIIRCVLESLALEYRKAFQELELLTGSKFTRLYLFGAAENGLLNHFVVNALQVPVILASPEAAAIGNVLVQALALRHIPSLGEAREILRNSIKTQAIIPHPTSWDTAATRMLELTATELTSAN